MAVAFYGIKNCETVKKARAWLDAHDIAHDFHNYKVAGADAARLARWCDVFGWNVVLNRSGTTFRALPDAAKQDLDQTKAISLMLAQPSMIKRPIVEAGDVLLIGFKPDAWAAAFAARAA